MKRKQYRAKSNLENDFCEHGFHFFNLGGGYWENEAYYELSLEEVEHIEQATEELYALCLQAVEEIIRRDWYSLLHIAPHLKKYIQASWDKREPTLYGRFDLACTGHAIKLLEFNADTPTSLLESGIAQDLWRERIFPHCQQFQKLSTSLNEVFKNIRLTEDIHDMHFTCMNGSVEDFENVQYLMARAETAGIKTHFCFLEDIQCEHDKLAFFDEQGRPISKLFKLYPWEWLVEDPFALALLHSTVRVVEPIWKMLLSNKGILPILWKLFPSHPYLLPSYFEEGKLKDNYVRKPLLSREGQNISICQSKGHVETKGIYGKEGFIYQAYSELPSSHGRHAVLGSWVIGGKAGGIGIREDESLITKNTSRFVPHVVVASPYEHLSKNMSEVSLAQ